MVNFNVLLSFCQYACGQNVVFDGMNSYCPNSQIDVSCIEEED